MAPISSLSTFAALILSLYTNSAVSEPGVLGLKFTKREITDPAAVPTYRLRRRQGTPEATIYNAQGNLLYLVNTTVGTPPQEISLQLDTGSSDIWIPTSSSSICAVDDRCTSGSYNQQESSTFEEVLQGQFQISYVDGTKIGGDYINETFGIAGATIRQMTMGTALAAEEPNADDTTPFQGIIGVAFDSGEAIVAQSNGQYGYPNIISQMVLQNVISTRAYSLWLNDLESPEGNILFGGVDDAKFDGALTILPLQVTAETGIVDSFTVTFAGVNITGNGGRTVYNAQTTVPVILDSGTTLTYLPDDIANAISAGVGAVSNRNYGVVVPCELANTQGQLHFQFGNSENGPTIRAEMSQFVLPFPSDIGPAPKFRDGRTMCRWGIRPAGQDPNLFGDTFLRSAYVVYNLEGNELGIAQTVFNATTEEIKQITAASSLPGATSTATGEAQQTVSGPIFNTDVGGDISSGATDVPTAATGTGLFDLGTGTGTVGATGAASSSAGAAARGLPAPSTPFVGVIAVGVTVLLGMVGGGVLILA
jgi:hypothetical protein